MTPDVLATSIVDAVVAEAERHIAAGTEPGGGVVTDLVRSARILDVSPAEYHADPAPDPSLSASIARLMLERSPRHARLAHPRLGGQSVEPTASQDRGSLLHRLVLGRGADIDVIEAADWRTKAAQEAREQARASGRIPILAHAMQAAKEAAEAIARELRALGIDLAGQSEVALLWQEAAEHGTIWCRGMLDHVVERDGRLLILDLKTCESAHPEACMRTAINFGYDIQCEAYTRVAEMAWPEWAGRVDFLFVFAEHAPPHGVTVARLDALMLQRGRRRWAAAVETWSRCLATDTWPGYAAAPTTLLSPAWLLYRESEAAEARGEDFSYER
jgi:hypothetical protein